MTDVVVAMNAAIRVLGVQCPVCRRSGAIWQVNRVRCCAACDPRTGRVWTAPASCAPADDWHPLMMMAVRGGRQ